MGRSLEKGVHPLLLCNRLSDTEFITVCWDLLYVYCFTGALVDCIHELGA